MAMLTLSKAAKVVNISTATLRRWAIAGSIPGAIQSDIEVGAGRVWLVPEESLAMLEGKIQPYGKRAPNYEKVVKKGKSA